MTIEIIKGGNNPVTDFFSSNTPETDECGSHEGNWDTKFFRMQFHARNLERQRNEARDQLIHLRSCVYDVIHSLKAGAFDELEKAWKEGLK